MESQIPYHLFHPRQRLFHPSVSLFWATESAQASEKEIEERKARCQTKKTQQREENCIVISLRCDENNKNQEEKTQAGSRSSTDCEIVVDKIRRLRTEGTTKKRSALPPAQ